MHHARLLEGIPRFGRVTCARLGVQPLPAPPERQIQPPATVAPFHAPLSHSNNYNAGPSRDGNTPHRGLQSVHSKAPAAPWSPGPARIERRIQCQHHAPLSPANAPLSPSDASLSHSNPSRGGNTPLPVKNALGSSPSTHRSSVRFNRPQHFHVSMQHIRIRNMRIQSPSRGGNTPSRGLPLGSVPTPPCQTAGGGFSLCEGHV